MCVIYEGAVVECRMKSVTCFQMHIVESCQLIEGRFKVIISNPNLVLIVCLALTSVVQSRYKQERNI